SRDQALAQPFAQHMPIGILGEHLFDHKASAGTPLGRRHERWLGQDYAKVFAFVEVVAGKLQIAPQILGGAVELAVLLCLVRLPEERLGQVARLQLMQAEHGAREQRNGSDEEDEEASIDLAHGVFSLSLRCRSLLPENEAKCGRTRCRLGLSVREA